MGSSDADGPVRRVHYDSDDVEGASELLRARYVEHEPMFSGSRDRFALKIDSVAVSSPVGGFQLDRLRHTMAVSALVEPLDHHFLGVVGLHGRVRYTWGRQQANSVLLAPSWTRFRTEWSDLDVLVYTLDLEAVRRIGAGLAGVDPAAVSFTDISPVAAASSRAFAAQIVHLKRDLLSRDDALVSPLVRAETFRHLATTLLLTFPNTALETLGDPRAAGPGRVEPATVRRAVAFIDEHAGEPIGTTEIAAAAGLGIRGLQHAFARHRDSTPLAYLRQVRLHRAHADLAAADPTGGDTVAGVAARWGFTHLGRFAADYRARFGRLPSATLRD